ncbi:MAG: hypothetical protein EOO15_21055 [Chitinophagaceae bacterium]|nr:MAG: hypothetical protein EOO15_21055 [Chitinophagaceae bacterium]
MKRFIFFMLALVVFLNANAQSKITDAVRSLYSNQFYESLSGAVQVHQTKVNTAVLTLSTTSSNLYDRAFVLTSDKAQPFPELSSKQASIFIHKDQRIVFLIDNQLEKVFVFGLDEAETQKEIERLRNNEIIGKSLASDVFLAYGLSYLTGGWKGDALAKSTYQDPFNYLAAADVTGRNGISKEAEDFAKNAPLAENICSKGSCTSGGAGSSDCEITEEYMGINQTCKVHCKDGYYSCCSAKSTRCYCCKD